MIAAVTCSQTSSRLPQSQSQSWSSLKSVTPGLMRPPRVETRRAISPSSSLSPLTASARTSSTPRDQAAEPAALRMASKSFWIASCCAGTSHPS